MRFLFSEARPSATSVCEALEPLVEPGVAIGPAEERQDSVSVLVEAADRADRCTLIFKGPYVSIHAAVGASTVAAAQRVLRELGGRYPPPVDQSGGSWDYGEAWLGLLAEVDDIVIAAGGGSFRLWLGILDRIEAAAPCRALDAFIDFVDSIEPGERASYAALELDRALRLTESGVLDDYLVQPLRALREFLRPHHGHDVSVARQ